MNRKSKCDPLSFQQTAGYKEYPESFQERINVFDEVKKNIIDITPNYHHKQETIQRIRQIESDKSKDITQRFIELRGVIDHVSLSIDRANRETPDKLHGKTIESVLWAKGIDVVYPDGSTYSQNMFGE